jgi:hypothetical protein
MDLLVDGDEFIQNLIQEVLETVKKIYIISLLSVDSILGDIYHQQADSWCIQNVWTFRGISLSLINKSQFSNLHVMGEYPQESYYTKNDFA